MRHRQQHRRWSPQQHACGRPAVADPARDARVLLAHAARIEASRVTLIAPEELSPEIAERYDQLISLRAIRVPVSHLLGEREFYGRRFRVSRTCWTRARKPRR